MSENTHKVRKRFKRLSRKEARLMVLLFVIANIAVISISTFTLKIPVVAVCTIALLEILLVNLLDRVPVWIHAVIILLQAASGFYVRKPAFMMLMAILYLIGLIIEIRARRFDE